MVLYELIGSRRAGCTGAFHFVPQWDNKGRNAGTIGERMQRETVFTLVIPEIIYIVAFLLSGMACVTTVPFLNRSSWGVHDSVTTNVANYCIVMVMTLEQPLNISAAPHVIMYLNHLKVNLRVLAKHTIILPGYTRENYYISSHHILYHPQHSTLHMLADL